MIPPILSLDSFLPTNTMASPTPFCIAVPDSKLELLKAKLDLVTFPDELEDSGQDYGAPLTDMKRLTKYWKSGFDWKKAEAMLNEGMPQYTMDVDVEGFGSLNVHYVHKLSERVNAIPLVFVHGWPG
ncbi:epoxide hydrolase, partial [Pterulicium gracile]